MKVIKVPEIPEEQIESTGFIGQVGIQHLVDTPESPHFIIKQVNFRKGARNKFHTHSVEQILIVTGGVGYVATEKDKVTVTTGDIIVIPANEKHWHGATEDSTFSHLYVIAPEYETTKLE